MFKWIEPEFPEIPNFFSRMGAVFQVFLSQVVNETLRS